MRVIIAGGRLHPPYKPRVIMDYRVYGHPLDTIYRMIELGVKRSGFQISEVVCGMAPGVDLLGRCWARDNNIPWVEFPPDWDTHGKAAGIKRNIQMGDYAKEDDGGLIALHDGLSRGTGHMITYANRIGLKVCVQPIIPHESYLQMSKNEVQSEEQVPAASISSGWGERKLWE